MHAHHHNFSLLGGALSITYACNGCASQWALFETSFKYELGCAAEISIAMQVAFIIAGCTHMTYYKVLNHALGIEGVSWPMLDSTIKIMYPIVKEMVDKMCSDAKDDLSICNAWTKMNWVHGVVLSRPLMARGWRVAFTARMLLSAFKKLLQWSSLPQASLSERQRLHN